MADPLSIALFGGAAIGGTAVLANQIKPKSIDLPPVPTPDEVDPVISDDTAAARRRRESRASRVGVDQLRIEPGLKTDPSSPQGLRIPTQ